MLKSKVNHSGDTARGPERVTSSRISITWFSRYSLDDSALAEVASNSRKISHDLDISEVVKILLRRPHVVKA